MKVSVWRASELGASEFDAWHALQTAGGFESPFLSPEFACDVDAVFPHARVAVVHDGNHLIGFLPFERGRLRSARGLAGGLANCQAFVCSPGFEPQIGEVLRRASVDVFTFHALLGPPGARRQGSIRPVESLTIDLARGFDQYLADARERGGRFVKEILRKQRRLDREHPGEVRFDFAGTDSPAVARLVAWKSAQYRRTGRPDPFSSRARELISRLVSRSDAALTGCVSTLSIGDQSIAIDFSLRSATVISGWFTAYDMSMSAWSPGAVATLSYIEAAAKAGLVTLELGTGDEEFKRRLADSAVELSSGWIGRPSAGLLVNRAMDAPPAWAERFIVSHPRLRRATRRALLHAGTVRTRYSGTR